MNYYGDDKAAELINLKPKLNIPDPRLTRGLENCDLCGNSLFREGYGDFSPEPRVFIHPKLIDQKAQGGETSACGCSAPAQASANGNGHAAAPDIDAIVKSITDQVMTALNGSAK